MTTEKFKEYFLKDKFYFVGSASSALYIYIKHSKWESMNILCPSNICYSIPYTIQYSNNYPLFYDVDITTGNPDYESIRGSIENNKDISAIVIPYMYGNIVAQKDKIDQLCVENKIKIIDDCAVSIGMDEISGVKQGKSDAVLFSFGKNKSIDIGCGGILAVNEDINVDYYELNIPNSYEMSESKIHIFDKMFKSILYSDYYYDLLPALGGFSAFIESAFVYKVEWTDKMKNNLAKRLSLLDEHRCRLLSLVSMLEEKIIYSDDFFIKYVFSKGASPWRFNILCTSELIRNDIVSLMLNNKLHVSTWYPPIDSLFGQEIKENSKKFSQSIINFDLKNATDSQIGSFIQILNSYEGPV